MRRYRGGVYVVRCNKPTAVVGLPLIGRHFAYVGETRSFAHRTRQHKGTPLPNDPFATNGQPWCDLKPRFYYFPLPWKWMRKLAEPLVVWTLFPVYNVTFNRHNPRRITRYRALKQRARRDAHREAHPFTAVALNWIFGFRWWHAAGFATFLALAAWMWMS